MAISSWISSGVVKVVTIWGGTSSLNAPRSRSDSAAPREPRIPTGYLRNQGHAENAIGSSLVQVTHAILHAVDCVAWFERVSSASNCADPPPRGDVVSGRVGVRFSCNPVSVFEGAVG